MGWPRASTDLAFGEAAFMSDNLMRAGEVSPVNGVDADALQRHLASVLPSWRGPPVLRQFHGGASNPTFLVTDEQSGSRYVLRMRPKGALLNSAHAVDREHRVMLAIAGHVPVPTILNSSDDASILGSEFYLMSFVPGRVYSTNRLEDMAPPQRTACYLDIARTMAQLHAIDPVRAGLEDFGRRGGYFQRQMSRWERQYRSAQTDQIDSMDRLIARLPGRIPDRDETRLVHGDLRMENVMIHQTEPRVAALLDWELSTLGDPLSDLAFFCLFHHADFMPWGSAADIDYAATGIPTEAEFVAAYCAAAGRDGVDDWAFLLSFAAFRLAAIAQGVYVRRLAAFPDAPTSNGAPQWAELARRLLD